MALRSYGCGEYVGVVLVERWWIKEICVAGRTRSSFNEGGRSTFEALPGPSNLRAADNSGVTEGPAQEGMDCEVAAFHNFHNYSLPCTIQAAHQNDRYHLYLLQSTWKLNLISQRNCWPVRGESRKQSGFGENSK